MPALLKSDMSSVTKDFWKAGIIIFKWWTHSKEKSPMATCNHLNEIINIRKYSIVELEST